MKLSKILSKYKEYHVLIKNETLERQVFFQCAKKRRKADHYVTELKRQSNCFCELL